MVFPFCGSKNQIIFSNYDNLNLDFCDNLQMKDSIIIKNSRNLNLTIDSKINKLMLYNSSNIQLKIKSTVTGIDIDKCYNINITPINPYDLKSIHAFKSNINLHIHNNEYDKFYFDPPFILINEMSTFQIKSI